MRLEPTEIPDVLQLVPTRHEDARGHFAETYNRSVLREFGLTVEFVQDNLSHSVRHGTVRGLHFQVPPRAQSKLVRCSRGAILDVAVDLRVGSPTFGAHVTRILSAENMLQLFIPQGFAHGFCTLSPEAEVLYKVDCGYAPDCERGIRYDDPALAIDWRLGGGPAFLSDRDRTLPLFGEVTSPFTCPDTEELSKCAS